MLRAGAAEAHRCAAEPDVQAAFGAAAAIGRADAAGDCAAGVQPSTREQRRRRRHIDRAAERVAPVFHRARPPHDLDAIRDGGVDPSEILAGPRPPRSRVQAHAVHQVDVALPGEAADDRRGLGAGGLLEQHARLVTQDLRQQLRRTRVDLAARRDRHRFRNREAVLCRAARRRHDHLCQKSADRKRELRACDARGGVHRDGLRLEQGGGGGHAARGRTKAGHLELALGVRRRMPLDSAACDRNRGAADGPALLIAHGPLDGCRVTRPGLTGCHCRRNHPCQHVRYRHVGALLVPAGHRPGQRTRQPTDSRRAANRASFGSDGPAIQVPRLEPISSRTLLERAGAPVTSLSSASPGCGEFAVQPDPQSPASIADCCSGTIHAARTPCAHSEGADDGQSRPGQEARRMSQPARPFVCLFRDHANRGGPRYCFVSASHRHAGAMPRSQAFFSDARPRGLSSATPSAV